MAESRERNVKQVVFGKEDDDIKEFIEELPAKFSTYVKDLIRRDMNGQDNSDIVEARLNEIITLLKKGAATGGGTAAKDNTVLSAKQRSMMDNAMNIFKTK